MSEPRRPAGGADYPAGTRVRHLEGETGTVRPQGDPPLTHRQDSGCEPLMSVLIDGDDHPFWFAAAVFERIEG
jgi:hypothetical protein